MMKNNLCVFAEVVVIYKSLFMHNENFFNRLFEIL